MFQIQIDAKPFEDQVRAMGDRWDQLPFALSRALNDAAQDTRDKLVDDTWPSHVTERNKGFIRWALQIERSNKQDLMVAIYDRSLGRAHLQLHNTGGTRSGAKGRFAIPTAAVTRTARGVSASQRPAALANKVVIKNTIYQRKGKGKKSRLVKMYTLTTSARQPADVPFSKDFNTTMRESIAKHFPLRMAEAMRSAR
jgi:hypothetical protein